MSHAPSEITDLLIDWSNGNREALERLFPLVEKELHRLARHYLRREKPGHTLQTTALIHETYLRLIDQRVTHWHNRAHFFGISAQIMRRFLLNYIRDQKRLKRGGGAVQISLSEITHISSKKSDDLLALDEALQRLAIIDERKSRVVELKFFGGLSVEETAEVLKISPITVMRDWKIAKAWLGREIENGE